MLVPTILVAIIAVLLILRAQQRSLDLIHRRLEQIHGNLDPVDAARWCEDRRPNEVADLLRVPFT